MSGVEQKQSPDTQIRMVGDERTPIIIIDQAIAAPEALIDAARHTAKFDVDARFAYPGVRADLPDDYVDALLPAVLTLLNEVYAIPSGLEPELIHRLFSLISTPPEDLALLQRIPHFDTLNRFYFASVHYLNPGIYAGTGLFRHRPTGFERIFDDRYSTYVQSAQAYMRANGSPTAQYINSTTDHYEMIEEIEYRPNRLVIYPGNLLHSGLIQPDRDVSADPVKGRLTANLFINFA